MRIPVVLIAASSPSGPPRTRPRRLRITWPPWQPRGRIRPEAPPATAPAPAPSRGAPRRLRHRARDAPATPPVAAPAPPAHPPVYLSMDFTDVELPSSSSS